MTTPLWELSPTERADAARIHLAALVAKRADVRQQLLTAQEQLADLDDAVEQSRHDYRAAVAALNGE